MNDPKVAELTHEGRFAEKVDALIGDLKSHGENPKIYEALRTVAQQRKKVRDGFSKTMKSEHLPDHTGKARAADVADDDLAWSASRRFWFLVGASSQARGLGWGGLFGLNKKQKGALVTAILRLRALNWPQRHELYKDVKVGWDPAHVQQTNNWKP